MRPIILYINSIDRDTSLFCMVFRLMLFTVFVVELNMNFAFCILHQTKNIADILLFRAPLLAIQFCITFQSNWEFVNNIRFMLSMSVIVVTCWPEVVFFLSFFSWGNSANSDQFGCCLFHYYWPKTYVNNFNILYFTHVWLTIVVEIVVQNVMQTKIKINTYHFAGSK